MNCEAPGVCCRPGRWYSTAIGRGKRRRPRTFRNSGVYFPDGALRAGDGRLHTVPGAVRLIRWWHCLLYNRMMLLAILYNITCLWYYIINSAFCLWETGSCCVRWHVYLLEQRYGWSYRCHSETIWTDCLLSASHFCY